jgi:DNA-binding transcriptional regulator YiaG
MAVDIGSYLAGMIDADGTVNYQPNGGSRRVGITNTNTDIIAVCEEMLTELGIEFNTHSWQPGEAGWSKRYDIHISGRKNLQMVYDLIPLQHPKKKALLETCLSTYVERFVVPSTEELTDLYITQDLSVSEIARRYGVSRRTVHDWLRKQEVPFKFKKGTKVL